MSLRSAVRALFAAVAIRLKDWNRDLKRYVGKELVYFLRVGDPAASPLTWAWMEEAQDVNDLAKIRAAIAADQCVPSKK